MFVRQTIYSEGVSIGIGASIRVSYSQEGRTGATEKAWARNVFILILKTDERLINLRCK